MKSLSTHKTKAQ